MRTNLQINQELTLAIAKDVDDIIPWDKVERAHQKDVSAWLRSGANPFRLKKPDIPPKTSRIVFRFG